MALQYVWGRLCHSKSYLIVIQVTQGIAVAVHFSSCLVLMGTIKNLSTNFHEPKNHKIVQKILKELPFQSLWVGGFLFCMREISIKAKVVLLWLLHWSSLSALLRDLNSVNCSEAVEKTVAQVEKKYVSRHKWTCQAHNIFRTVIFKNMK